MLFTQKEFYVFLIIIVFLIAITKNNTYKKVILLLANLYFYAYFDYRLLLLLLVATQFTHITGRKIEFSRTANNQKLFLILGVSVNICILFIFKYYNFFFDNLKMLFPDTDANYQGFNLILPLGISFYIFRFVSYQIDIYRKSIKSANVFNFLLYGTFFPIIVSGPISRAISFLPQLNKIEITIRNLYLGLRLFIIGLFLKVFIADRIGGFVNYFYDNYQLFNTTTTWLALLSYNLQIYCDFAGYSSMAIGIAQIFNIQIEDNFNFT
jgi:alginate O-acetyltransferase complex protein AlgI